MEPLTHFTRTIRCGCLRLLKEKSNFQEAIVVPLNLQGMMSVQGMGKDKRQVSQVIRCGRLDEITTECNGHDEICRSWEETACPELTCFLKSASIRPCSTTFLPTLGHPILSAVSSELVLNHATIVAFPFHVMSYTRWREMHRDTASPV